MNIIRYSKKCLQLGIAKSTRIAKNQLQKKLYRASWRHVALQHSASHSWQNIVKKNTLHPDFSLFCGTAIKSKKWEFIDIFCKETDKKSIITQADSYTQNSFDILGSGPTHLQPLLWHTDFKHQASPGTNASFDSSSFYQDIQITTGENNLQKDIKIPWELSVPTHHNSGQSIPTNQR